MSNYNRSEKMAFYTERRLETSKMWLLFLLAGWSYGSMGQMGKQFAYYITAGGFGLWFLYRLFTLGKKANAFNLEIAKQVGFDEADIKMLGLVEDASVK